MNNNFIKSFMVLITITDLTSSSFHDDLTLNERVLSHCFSQVVEMVEPGTLIVGIGLSLLPVFIVVCSIILLPEFR